MKPFFKQFIFISTAIIIFGAGVLAVIAVNNRGSAPVAYWKFDEGYGSTTYDAAGANDGAIYNALWKNEPDCKMGKCLWFDGSGDYVDAGDVLDIGTGDIFLSAWIRTVQTATNRIISKQEGSNQGYLFIMDSTGTI